MTQKRPTLTDRLSAFIGSYPNKRVPLTALREHAINTDPTFVADPAARQRLHNSLTELRERRDVSWPKSPAGFDTRALPELPRWVARTATPLPDRPGPASRVWPSALEPAARIATRADEQQLLTAVAAWMAANPTPIIVPLQERSLEITGDEKRLDKLTGTRLFTSGALTLEMLACAPPLLPFASTHVEGVGNTRLLVAENSATYQSLTQAIRELPKAERPDTHVAWGAGRQFPIAAEHVTMLDPSPTEYSYFGDLDLAGLQIAVDADTTISRLTGLPLRPATSLYETALRRGTPRPDPSNKAETVPDLSNLIAWLPTQLQDEVQTLIEHRNRIPQETVGLTLLLQHPELYKV